MKINETAAKNKNKNTKFMKCIGKKLIIRQKLKQILPY